MTKTIPPAGRKRGAKPAARPSPVPWIAIVAVVAIASATMLYVVRQKRSGAGTPSESAAASAPAASSAGPQAANDTVEVVVLAAPPEAIISLDGTPVIGNPFRAQVPRSGAMRKLTVSAEGYETQDRAVVFDEDSTLKITLVHSGGGVAAPRGAVGGPARVTKTPDMAAPSTVGGAPSVGDRLKTDRDPGRTSRTIDDKDPYSP